jgi:hypothetical protein
MKPNLVESDLAPDLTECSFTPELYGTRSAPERRRR